VLRPARGRHPSDAIQAIGRRSGSDAASVPESAPIA